MVKNISKAAYCRASDCWCRSRICVRYRVVFFVAFFYVQCISSLLFGSCGDCFKFIGILRGLLLLYCSPLVLACKFRASVIPKMFFVHNFVRNSSTLNTAILHLKTTVLTLWATICYGNGSCRVI